MDSFLVYCSICCFLVLSTDGVTLTLEMKSSLPLKGSSLELSCIISDPFNSNYIVVWKESSQVTICFADSGLCNFYKNGYSFTANRTGAFGSISSLTTEAEGTWRCSYNTTYSNSLSLIVYTIPPGLSITQNPNQDVDLNVDSVVLQCKTIGCTYPMPTVRWMFRNQITTSEIAYITNNPTGIQETCAAQEKIYTSTLHLPLYTRLNDNSIKTGTFSCRIEYPDSSRNIIAFASHTVRFAVILTLKPNNQIYVNNGGTLSLTCDVNQNLGFSSVLFRIESNIKFIITNIYSCSSINGDADDSSTYNVTCIGQKTFAIVKYGISSSDHNKRWNCLLTSANAIEGSCIGGDNPCLSSGVTVLIIVPVTTVRLSNDSGQVLHSSVNIVRGVSTDIICNTAPSGSRPRALFQWYYRQGNQSPVLIVDQSISTTTVPGQSDILISYSTWRLTGNASYHNMYIYCQAQDETNTGNYTKSDEIQLNIVYPPAVQLSTYQSANNVTEGMQDFVFMCNITESNPLPQANSYSWFHKRSIIKGQTSSSYTLQNVQKSDAGEYMCTARNYYGEGTSNSLDLIVQYPPNITVILTGSTHQNQTAVLICGAVGVPVVTTFFPWIQRWRDVVIRTGLQGTTNSTHSVVTLNRLSLESMGTYICTANNGIMGTSGTLNQNGSESLQFKGKAIVLIDSDKFVGEIGLSVNVSIPFYSDPVIMKFVIQTENREIMNTSRTVTYLSKEVVNYQFYNIAIQLDAQKANVVIQNVTTLDFDNYTLVLTNSFGSTSFKFRLDPFVTPEKPFNFHPTNVQEKQLSLRWQSGYNWGYTQTFIVEISLDNITWNNVSQVSAGNRDGWFTAVIEDLMPGSGYYLRLYAYNINGRGDFADVQLAIRTLKDFSASVGIGVGGAVGVGIGGAVGVGFGGMVLGLIGAIIAFTIRRKLNGSKCSCFRSKKSTDNALHTYSNTEMNPQTVKPVYEELNKRNTEQSVYDKISPL